ncbi:MAG: ARMT1-like domain-containing protein, partial [Planctomycetota bacterium]
ARMTTDDRQKRMHIMRRVMRKASSFPDDAAPPAMGAAIHRIIREATDDADPYREIKRRANEFALELLPDARDTATGADRPFETALRLAIAGNIMDWGAKPHADISEDAVERTLHEALEAPLVGDSPEDLKRRIQGADDVLYLADNAGEIVFDRLLISLMPCPQVTVAVKGSPTINDATMEDARQVDLVNRAEVVDTGSDTPGVLLEQCSDDFVGHFESADMVIAKGQGNYEALSGVDRQVVFLLKAKCPVVARDIGCEVGNMLLLDYSRNLATSGAEAQDDAAM